MTKTCNFPGMKQARRAGALARVEKSLDAIKDMSDAETIKKDRNKVVFIGYERRRLQKESAALRERIANVTWFTKKRRTA